MANTLQRSVKEKKNISKKRFVRPDEISKKLDLSIEEIMELSLAAGARYQLPRITIINQKQLEDFMKHLYKVPGTNKIVHKKYVRIGEGSTIYSIGHHRFVAMARAAGAVYKIGDAQGSTILINLEIFDLYMEQFRVGTIEMKNPLWKSGKEGSD